MTPMDAYETFSVPLAAPDALTDLELAAVRAGIPLDWSYLDYDCRR